LLLQILIVAAGLVFLEAYTEVVFVTLEVISAIVAIRIISSDDNPAYKLAWILPVLVIPIFGTATYLFYKSQAGVKILKKNAVNQKFAAAPLLPQSDEVLSEIDGLSNAFFGLCSYMKNYGGFPVYKNKTADYLSSGEEFYEAFLRDLNNAKKFILLEFFIVDDGIMWESILAVLREKSSSGVEVKIMYDGMGSQMGLPSGYEKKIRSLGLVCHVFNPIRPLVSSIQNNRDHRKIAVIDGLVAYTGGINLADEYINKRELYGHWKDTAVRVTGDAVWSFTVMFFELWNIASMDPKTAQTYERKPEMLMNQANRYRAEKTDTEQTESGFVLPFSDSPIDDEHIAESAYLDMINRANKYVYISSPYLVVDNDMLKTLAYAAKRGVDVRILTPKIQDKPYMQILARSYYKGLIQGGVKIYEYTPGFNHAKILVADDRIAEVGSVNFDFRSLYLHFECAAILFMCPAIMQIKQDMLDTYALSEEITLDTLKTYSLPRRAAGRVLKLFAPLL
jgi:cardiolipin synthase